LKILNSKFPTRAKKRKEGSNMIKKRKEQLERKPKLLIIFNKKIKII
jgi:hypothetical protein